MLQVLLELVYYSQYLVAIHFYSLPCSYIPTENLNIFSKYHSGITAEEKDVKSRIPSVDHLVLGFSIKPLLSCHNCKLLAVVAVSKHLVAYIWCSKNDDNRSIVTYKASRDIADDQTVRVDKKLGWEVDGISPWRPVTYNEIQNILVEYQKATFLSFSNKVNSNSQFQPNRVRLRIIEWKPSLARSTLLTLL